ncbi:calcium/proton exchanger [Gonapodya prolifera JEL478]|uniref:Vacuolar calcium ion transporter n=1 Tax=Gonapodya prolifera (strain JEL478) TaxID=1344416 RepID=A0A139A9A0_GONPJ|nr:calcium/proton exchanger [Gonapodya prolifera JEL478]|eukprot:KXS13239.1 calcium/proton exchanger [Gonapodya prolifera JEL478]
MPLSEESPPKYAIDGETSTTTVVQVPEQEATTENSETHHQPEKDGNDHKPKTALQAILSSFKAILFATWLNLLLICVPIGIAAGYADWNDVAVFFINFAAIIPLAKLLGFATEELALRTNETIGGLLNASFGNAVELIIGILAVKDNLIRIVQASIIGSILSNLLLVLGFCFFFGGLRYREQKFNKDVASTSTSLLAVTSLVFLLPAAFFYQLEAENNEYSDQKVLNMSRGVSIVLLIVYGCYLYFQLRTHSDLFTDVAKAETGEEEEGEEPQLTPIVAVILLVVSTVFVALCAESLVGSIEGLSKQWGLTESFVGLVLLPIVGNAAEHLTAVSVAMKNKMDLSIGVAVGSSLQIALLVAPVLVIIAWITNVPLTLDFTIFEVAVSFVCVFIVNALIADGKSNWLEGALLLGAYLVVAIAFFFLP